MKLSAWDSDKVDKLKLLWDIGLSASKIGTEIAMSRCAVLAKAFRLKLTSRAHPEAAYRARPRASRSKVAIAKRAAERDSRRAVAVREKPRAKVAQPDYSKSQLRAILADAVRNTAAMS